MPVKTRYSRIASSTSSCVAGFANLADIELDIVYADFVSNDRTESADDRPTYNSDESRRFCLLVPYSNVTTAESLWNAIFRWHQQ